MIPYKVRLMRRIALDYLNKIIEFHDNYFMIVFIEFCIIFSLIIYNLPKAFC